MEAYKSTRVHLLFGTLLVLLIIWLSDFAGLWNSLVSTIMTIISLTIILSYYVISRRIPKHNDDIHFHDKDEHTPVRH